jgi:hypothetical protein
VNPVGSTPAARRAPGAVDVFESVDDLREKLDLTPLR